MAIKSQGIQVEWNGTVIGEIISDSGPGGTAAIIDVSHQGSTAVEKLISIPDEGQFTMEVNWLSGDSAQDALRADRASGTKRTCRLLLVDTSGTILTFDAYCMGVSLSTAVGQQAKGSISLEIDGEVHYSPRLVEHTAYNAGTIVLDLEEDTFGLEAAVETTTNWTWAYGGSGLVINTVTKDSSTRVTINYTTAGQNSGTWTLTIQAKVAALTGSYPSGVFRFTITIA